MTENITLVSPLSVLWRILFIIKLLNKNLIYNMKYEPTKIMSWRSHSLVRSQYLTLYFPSLHKEYQSNQSYAWNARKSRTTWFTEQLRLEYLGAAFMELCASTVHHSVQLSVNSTSEEVGTSSRRKCSRLSNYLFSYGSTCLTRIWIPGGQINCFIHLFNSRAQDNNFT